MKTNDISKYIFLGATIGFLCLFSCTSNVQTTDTANEPKPIIEQVDNVQSLIMGGISGDMIIATLDHHRMAKDAGVYTPPAIATIFSDPEVNTALLAEGKPLIGLDLPYKVICYSEPDTTSASVAFTSGEFVAKRHGMSVDQLGRFSSRIDRVLGNVSSELVVSTSLDSVYQGYGIIIIQSDYGFDETIQNLRDIVMAQSDTKWFGDIDYRAEAALSGTDIPPNTLLLFGGPAPGGKAMMTTPKIGLDAFCQKLLVYENENGEVSVAFNDIVAFSKLYYGTATKPQLMINERLIQTFTKAVRRGTASE